MMKKDYYEVLGVDKSASLADIKKKYRSLALKHHPDRVEADQKAASEEKFKEISEAYGVLSDSKKRQMYDQYGHSGIDQNFTSDDIFRGADFNSVFGDSGLGDIFSQFFGGDSSHDIFGGRGRGQGREVQRGRDIQYEVDVTLEESYTGIARKIKVPRQEYCKSCDATGARDAKKLKTCPTCKGRGQVLVSSGFFRMSQTCSDCRGQGHVITEYCPKCNGKGALRVTRNIDVNIPAGVDNSTRLRVQNEGEIGKDGPGDLYLYIHILPNQTFKREGDDLYMQLPISFVKATLGGEALVPTLNGKVTMKIPAGTQSSKLFRLRGKGMPHIRSGAFGDLYVEVYIDVPQKISSEQKRVLEDFAQLSGEKVSTVSKTLKDTIKKVFK